MVGVEAVIDKDLCSELLARDLEADLLIMATDAKATGGIVRGEKGTLISTCFDAVTWHS